MQKTLGWQLDLFEFPGFSHEFKLKQLLHSLFVVVVVVFL